MQKGVRRVMLMNSVLCIAGCLLSCIPSTWVMLIGRIVYGFSAGVSIVAASSLIHDMIPDFLQEQGFSESTNFAIVTSVLASMLLSYLLPKEDA